MNSQQGRQGVQRWIALASTHVVVVKNTGADTFFSEAQIRRKAKGLKSKQYIQALTGRFQNRIALVGRDNCKRPRS